MKAQFITTDGGEELVLVVYSRREYDVLLARLGDEEAEDRMTAEIVDQHLADAEGRANLLPDWLVDASLDGIAPVRAIRTRAGLDPAQLARTAGLTPARLDAIEAQAAPPSEAETARLAEALGVRAAWLEPLA